MAVVQQVVRQGEAGRAEPDDEDLVAGRRPRQGPPDVERVPAGQQRIDLEPPGEAEHVLEGAGLDLRDVDRVLPLKDAGLHAVVADAVPGRRADRVVDGNDGEGAEAVAPSLHQVHFRDLLFERAAGEGDAENALLEGAVLLLQPLRAAVLALVVAPDAVIRLVERASEIGAGVGQRKAVAAPPLVLGQPQHRDPVALDGFDRHEVVHVEPMRDLEQHAAPVLVPAFGGQCRPGGITLRDVERLRIASLVLEPFSDVLGIAPLPLWNRFIGRRAHDPIQVAGQPGPVDRHGIAFLDALDGAPLNKQTLDRIERRQLVMARLQLSDLGFDPEQPADKVLQMRREIDQQVGFLEPLDRVGVAPRRHHPFMQSDIAPGQVGNKRPIEPHEAVAIIKIGEREPVLEDEIGHLSQVVIKRGPTERSRTYRHTRRFGSGRPEMKGEGRPTAGFMELSPSCCTLIALFNRKRRFGSRG